jgi:hypothetical protein
VCVKPVRGPFAAFVDNTSLQTLKFDSSILSVAFESVCSCQETEASALRFMLPASLGFGRESERGIEAVGKWESPEAISKGGRSGGTLGLTFRVLHGPAFSQPSG